MIELDTQRVFRVGRGAARKRKRMRGSPPPSLETPRALAQRMAIGHAVRVADALRGDRREAQGLPRRVPITLPKLKFMGEV